MIVEKLKSERSVLTAAGSRRQGNEEETAMAEQFPIDEVDRFSSLARARAMRVSARREAA